jgi:hypothetical protein
MAEWLTIEVFDGEFFPAASWWRAHGQVLQEAAYTNRALDVVQHEHRWGVVVEVLFDEDSHLAGFRELPAVLAVLDAVPDKMSGLLVYRGRGGGGAALVPSKPRPVLSSAAAMREPEPDPVYAACSATVPASPVHA